MNEFLDAIETMLIDKAIMFRALTFMLAKAPVDGADATRFVESVIVDVKRKRNEHTRSHGERYHDKCLFCVEAVAHSNKPQ